MGIRDYLSSTAETLSGGLSRSRDILSGSGSAAAPYLSGAWQSTRGLARVASESAVWTRDAAAERMPDRHSWERLGRLGWRIADHAIDHGTKTYTCGIPVYRFVKEELRKGNRLQQEEEERRAPKERREDAEVAVLRTRIERIEKENMELQNLKLKMKSVEMRLMQIQQETEKKKKKMAQKRREDWDPPELVHLI